MEPQKRKIQDETDSSIENKKPHSDLEFSSSEMSAESTLRGDLNNTIDFERFVDAHATSNVDEDEEGSNSNLNTIISVVESLNENEPLSNDKMKSITEKLKEKEEEVESLELEQ